jgi:hypothetical protein
MWWMHACGILRYDELPKLIIFARQSDIFLNAEDAIARRAYKVLREIASFFFAKF